MAEEPEPIEVDILNVRKYTVGPPLGEKIELVDILFMPAGMTPMVVTLRAEEDTPEMRAAKIRARIEEEKAKKPEKLTV